MPGQRAQENEVVVDSTVQEKNVTYPVDTKQRLRKDPRRRKAARRGHRRLRTIAGTLIRELERKLPEALRKEQSAHFILYRRVLAQKSQDTDKIYSLHEPHIYCVAKARSTRNTNLEPKPQWR